MAKRERRTSSKGPDSTGRTAEGTDRKTRSKGSGRSGRSTWRLLDRGSSVAAGLLAREVSQISWRAATGRRPPVAGRHPEVDAKEAVAWALVGGALVELVKLLVRRWAAVYWVRSTGNLPPGMKPVQASIAPTTTKEPAPRGEPAPDVVRRRTRGRAAQ